ncbi:(Na+)-NQR maturation NqrM [Gammaproteobacteria bacterium]|nr:(Na+)-NQR maturation NqrM [Gammaproteobacteria bacterium]
MNVFFVVFALTLFGVAAAAIGVMMGRKPIAGSCGGINAAMGKPQNTDPCEFCGRPPGETCEDKSATL